MHLRYIAMFSLSHSDSFTYIILHLFLLHFASFNIPELIYRNELHWFPYCDWFCTLLRVSRTQLWFIRTVTFFVPTNSYFFNNFVTVSWPQRNMIMSILSKSKAVPLQAWSSPEGSRKLRLPDFVTTAERMVVGCQPYAPAAFTPRKCSWYSFLLEAESTPEP